MTGEIALRVHVTKKLPESKLRAADIVPRELEGVLVDVIESNPVPHRTTRRDPLIGGVETGNENCLWVPEGVTALPVTSWLGPALAWDGNRTLIGWIDKDRKRLSFMSTRNGTDFFNEVNLSETSNSGLALTYFRNRYVVAWVGRRPDRINVMTSPNGRSWGNHVILREPSNVSPALAVLDGRLYLAWKGRDDDRIHIMRSKDARKWTSSSGKPFISVWNTPEPALMTCTSPCRSTP